MTEFVCSDAGVDPDCRLCGGTGILCEDHPDQPWSSEHQDLCGPGMPCREARGFDQ